MRNTLLILLFSLCLTSSFGQLADSVVVDSLEVEVAEEEILYKEDTTDLVSIFCLATWSMFPAKIARQWWRIG